MARKSGLIHRLLGVPSESITPEKNINFLASHDRISSKMASELIARLFQRATTPITRLEEEQARMGNLAIGAVCTSKPSRRIPPPPARNSAQCYAEAQVGV